MPGRTVLLCYLKGHAEALAGVLLQSGSMAVTLNFDTYGSVKTLKEGLPVHAQNCACSLLCVAETHVSNPKHIEAVQIERFCIDFQR